MWSGAGQATQPSATEHTSQIRVRRGDAGSAGRRKSLIRFLWMIALVSCVTPITGISQGRSSKRPLGKFIRHFEPVRYSLDSVEAEHAEWRAHTRDPNRLPFILEIWAYGRVFRLVLSEDREILPPSVVHKTGSGGTVEFDAAHQAVGSVHGDRRSHVHGFVVGGRFRGVIETGGDVYHVEPARAYFSEPQPFHSVMYRDSDVEHEKILKGRPLDMVRFARDQLHRVRREGGSATGGFSTTVRSFVECQIAVAGDHYYAELIAKEEAIAPSDDQGLRAAMTRTMALYVREANKILQSTTFFKESGLPEGFRLSIGTAITFVSQAEMRQFNNNKTRLHEAFLGAGPVLDEWSKVNWDRFCLSHLFTNRQFSEGILGLAFVSGVCDKFSTRRKSSLNVAMVTQTNEGTRLPASTTKLVYVHELGHNWGARHDSSTCLPSNGAGGKYIMYKHANDGSLANNLLFSPCSTTSMSKVLNKKAFVDSGGCFKPPSNGSICGNHVLEKEEECDCGRPSQCRNSHFCCTTVCKLKSGAMCSPQQGPCCSSSSCKFVQRGANLTCSEYHECRHGRSTCNGMSSECPLAPPRPNGILCNKGKATCKDGDCAGSLCAYFKLERCFCTAPSQCHVCCKLDGKCRTLSSLAATGSKYNVTGLELFLAPGAPCSDFSGYCNFLHYCRQLSDTSALLAVHDFLFSSSTYLAAWAWLKEHWWAGFLSLFLLVILFALVIYFCSFKTPQRIKRPPGGGRMRSATTTSALRPSTSSSIAGPLPVHAVDGRRNAPFEHSSTLVMEDLL